MKTIQICVALFLVGVFITLPRDANAGCTCCMNPSCVTQAHEDTREHISLQHNATRFHFGFTHPITRPYDTGGASCFGPICTYGISEMGRYQTLFLMNVLFRAHIAPALMQFTEQLVTVMMQQILSVGMFFDAELQMDAQRLLRELHARAHKDYHPSTGMCEFGTNVRSLAAAEHNGYLAKHVLDQRFQNRMMGLEETAASESQGSDRFSRFTTFRENYCSRADLNAIQGKIGQTGLFLCSGQPLSKGNTNIDIDYTRSIMLPRTMDYDFGLANAGSDQQAIDMPFFAMSSNLYGHDVFEPKGPSRTARRQGRLAYSDLRSVAAKRSVAHNSFSALVSLKARGTGPDNRVGPGDSQETGKYMVAIMEQLGINPDDAYLYLAGSRTKSKNDKELSYYAQMEILSKKIYQRPEFYTDLYDKPANVRRKSVAMQAVGTMLEREIFESYLRSEMLLAMILEAKLQPVQTRILRERGLLN